MSELDRLNSLMVRLREAKMTAEEIEQRVENV